MYDIFRDEWIAGYRVTAFPFKDKVLVHVEYVKPGSALSRPAWEFTAYLAGEDESKLREFPNTVIEYLVSAYLAHRKEARA